jgi:hypothetical protein
MPTNWSITMMPVVIAKNATSPETTLMATDDAFAFALVLIQAHSHKEGLCLP